MGIFIVEDMTVNRKTILLFTIFCLFMGVLLSFAQYSGSQLEQKQQSDLYPKPGPGDLLITEHLKETNRLLGEQNKVLTEQNQILTDMLAELKKQKSEEKH